jgi:hypothetical protein
MGQVGSDMRVCCVASLQWVVSSKTRVLCVCADTFSTRSHWKFTTTEAKVYRMSVWCHLALNDIHVQMTSRYMSPYPNVILHLGQADPLTVTGRAVLEKVVFSRPESWCLWCLVAISAQIQSVYRAPCACTT